MVECINKTDFYTANKAYINILLACLPIYG
uniref:Uncharacterized protein n=1 Tax=Anguilla anguilla TaxID=7936 RepID=A0A0E9SNV9_ANGAN